MRRFMQVMLHVLYTRSRAPGMDVMRSAKLIPIFAMVPLAAKSRAEGSRA
jgi:hypothetical protein